MPTHQYEPSSADLQQRARLFRRARLAVIALVIGYFFLPYGVRAWIPVWLPFAAALALEVQFFVGGYRAGRRVQPGEARALDRGPQLRDLVELGSVPEWEDDELYGYEFAEPRRYLRRLAEALAAIAIVAGILFYASRPHGWDAVSKADRARAEAVFSREATKIAGHPASVICDTSGGHVGVVQDADGAAQVGGRVAYLVPSLCDSLYQLAFKHRVQSFSNTARALAVLAHEAWHLNGIAANASDSAGDSRYLVPPGCRDGGEYDLHRGSDQFP